MVGVRAVLSYLLLLALGARTAGALRDDATDPGTPALTSNIITDDSTDAEYSARFGGDTGRYVRQTKGPGVIAYNQTDVSRIAIEFYTLSEALDTGSWTLWIFLGEYKVGQVFAQLDIGAQLARSTEPKVTGKTEEGIRWTLSRAAIEGWHSGTITVDALEPDQIEKTGGCQDSVRIEIRGGTGVFDDFQIGSVAIESVDDTNKGQCTSATANCDQPVSEPCTAQKPQESALSYWYNGANDLDALYSHENIVVVKDLPDGLPGGPDGYQRPDTSKPGKAVHRFVNGGMVQMAVTFAVAPADDIPEDGFVTVRPYVNLECRIRQEPSYLKQFRASQTTGNWSVFDIVYELGPIPELACKLPVYAEMEFFVPQGYDIRIAAIRISGDGGPAADTLQSIPDLQAQPQERDLLNNMLFVWIAAGVGVVLILFLLVLLWYCCGRPTCCGTKQREQAHLMHASGKGGALGASGMHGHAVISADAVYPSDMPQSLGDEGRYAAADKGAYGLMAGKHVEMLPMSARGAGGARQEPVVDLSVPMHGHVMHHEYQPNLALSAPRQGQDIFDTWQHTGLGYHSGDDMEASGPLDVHGPSFTANPPMSSTGNTSPTQESSVLGVTAQLGMRLNELKGLQGEHERVAKGQYDSNGEMTVAPEPLGVTYGKKIGVGGFGAVYEGTWSNKQVAVKVIKMPQASKPGEEKTKMAYMEYAISGILLHDNIVQTYQADIRPVFLEDDGQATTASRSGWTGIGDFLSNDAISAQLQRSMRIQEWELRLVMEYCNKGNLKEAIRNGHLQVEGYTRAMDVALLALDVAQGCQAIHKYNIIHGDLKPHNVLLTECAERGDERGWVGKIADFGLSVKIKRGEQHVSGIQHGTEGYVAPEVLQTRRMVKASDVYSFGIIMWELWHARLYYEEHRNAVKRMRRPNLEFRPTFERRCPEEWINLAKLCWSLKPEERPDFDRVVKMMTMIVASIRDKVNDRGYIPAEALNLI